MQNSNTNSAQQQEFGRHMSRVAQHLLGQPNRALSKQDELRFGTNGSLSVDLRKGTFFDFEANEGGGVLDLVKRQKGLTGSAAIEFMREIGCDIPAKKTHKRELVASFDYCNADGSLAFQVRRFEPKQFVQRRPDGKGGWEYKGGPPLLYRLPQVLEAVAQGQTIFVVEGEGKVEALVKWNMPATCNAGGARKWKPEHSGYLRGADVVILPDHDSPGRNHADVVSAALHGVASSVRVLELPDLGPKDDIVNWIEAGGTREIFLNLVETEARPYRGRPKLHIVSDTGKFIEAKYDGENDDDKNVAALARLSLIDYDRVRAYEADRLGCRAQTLDKIVKAQRKNKQPKPAVEVDKEALGRSAAHIINSKDVLGLFMKECSKVVAGEESNAKLLYLIGTSRLLNKTMHGAIKGTSAGGKSEMRKRTLEFFPPESVVSFTSLSEKFLIYYEDDFQHKILSMGEAVATDEQDFQDYLLRELMSEGRIRHSTVQKVGNEMMTVTIEKEGPVSFMVTTTKN
jgi:hypothetical protein